jgi:hypothetical protein
MPIALVDNRLVTPASGLEALAPMIRHIAVGHHRRAADFTQWT